MAFENWVSDYCERLRKLEEKSKRIFPDGPYEFIPVATGKPTWLDELNQGDLFHIHYESGLITGPFKVVSKGNEGSKRPYVDYILYEKEDTDDA